MDSEDESVSVGERPPLSEVDIALICAQRDEMAEKGLAGAC